MLFPDGVKLVIMDETDPPQRIRNMKIMALAATMALIGEAAFAHPSVVSHEHPHGLSWLPDVGALLVAAVLIGAGILAFRHFSKG